MKSLPVKSAFGGAVALLAMSTGAWAADLGPYNSYTPAPQPEVRYDSPSIWQGAYVGINGGYGWSDSNPTSAEGGFGGAQVGYNWQRGRLVFGIEGDFQGGDIGGSVTDFDATLHSEINWFSTVRGRLGIATGPWLIYGTGGVAFADIDTRVRFDDGDSWKTSGTETGYAVGGGLEWAFAQNWSAKAEYLFVGLGEDDFGVNNDFHSVRLGLNYKF